MTFVVAGVFAVLGVALAVHGVRRLIHPQDLSRPVAAGFVGVGGLLGAVSVLAFVAQVSYDNATPEELARRAVDREEEKCLSDPACVAERSRAAAQAKADAEARARAEAEARAAREAARCRADFECWSAEVALMAAGPCSRAIERKADYGIEWTDGLLDQRFALARPDGETGNIMFLGDTLKVQNGFGAWMQMRYACTFDPDGGVVVDVALEPGRF